MSYATQAQIVIACGGQVAFDQLFDYDGDGIADVDVLAQAQVAADSMIDARLNLRYVVGNPPPALQMIAAEETAYQARKWRPALGNDLEQEKAHHEQRMKALDEMRHGDLRPADPALSPSNAGNKAAFVENCSPMSRENSKGSIW